LGSWGWQGRLLLLEARPKAVGNVWLANIQLFIREAGEVEKDV
jgi:hypothetical protein